MPLVQIKMAFCSRQGWHNHGAYLLRGAGAAWVGSQDLVQHSLHLVSLLLLIEPDPHNLQQCVPFMVSTVETAEIILICMIRQMQLWQYSGM